MARHLGSRQFKARRKGWHRVFVRCHHLHELQLAATGLLKTCGATILPLGLHLGCLQSMVLLLRLPRQLLLLPRLLRRLLLWLLE